jgi:hypothetical protein
MNNLKLKFHKDDKLYSATFIKTGMFAYGNTEDEAVNKLKMMMCVLIDESYKSLKISGAPK